MGTNRATIGGNRRPRMKRGETVRWFRKPREPDHASRRNSVQESISLMGWGSWSHAQSKHSVLNMAFTNHAYSPAGLTMMLCSKHSGCPGSMTTLLPGDTLYVCLGECTFCNAASPKFPAMMSAYRAYQAAVEVRFILARNRGSWWYFRYFTHIFIDDRM